MKQNERELILLNIIKQLEFEDFDEVVSIDKFESLFNKTGKEVKVISGSDIDLSEATEDYFFLIYDSSNSYRLEDIKKSLSEKLLELGKDSVKNVYLIEVFDSIERKVEINNAFIGDRVSQLRDYAYRILKSEELIQVKSNVKYLSFIVPENLDSNHKVNIRIKDRIRSLEQKFDLDKCDTDKNKKPVLNSFVFTAEVDSIVDLYNLFGDNLFAKNVRVGGVTDSIGVEDDIKNTYNKTPEEFWFLNNGISLLIASAGELNMDVYDRISFSIADLKDISIINGAQTLKALSEVRYNKNNNSVKPTVLLRVYHYNSNQSKDSEIGLQKFKDFSEKVTISLNKQKPIHQEDLAYLTNFVKNTQLIRHKLSEDNNSKGLAYDFVRKGEIESFSLCQYHLRIFAKIVKAYLLRQPGTARSQSYNKLLKTSIPNANDVEKGITEGKLYLEDKGVFKEEFQNNLLEIVNEDKIKEFIKCYAPINFAMRLKKYLEEESNFKIIVDQYYKEKKDFNDETKAKLDSFVKYGSLFLISVIINSINNYCFEDFSEWKYSKLVDKNENNIEEWEYPESELKKLICKILDVFITFESKEISEDVNDSNFWKKNEIYTFIITKMKDIKNDSTEKEKQQTVQKKRKKVGRSRK